jgi:glycosyltransferase
MKISIITVCLNTAETIEDTMKSVLSQEYEDVEHIVVDGGSTDGTLDTVNRYAEHTARIVSEPDKGIYDAMNKGIRLATGQIIGFLNSGDVYMDENVIGRIEQALETNNADCCYGDLEYVAENNPSNTIRRWKSQPYRDGLFKKGWHPPHPTFFVKRAVLQRYGVFDLRYEIGSDYELMLRLLKKHGITWCYIPAVLVKMRTGGRSNKSVRQIVKANIECYKAWKRNNLSVSPFIMVRKPLSKVVQYL